MPRIAPEEVREIAALARLRLDDAEVARMAQELVARMAQELDAILGYIDTVKKVVTDDTEPMTHAVPFACPLREDVAGESLAVDEALRNAPQRHGNFFEVPRIIGGPSGGEGM